MHCGRSLGLNLRRSPTVESWECARGRIHQMIYPAHQSVIDRDVRIILPSEKPSHADENPPIDRRPLRFEEALASYDQAIALKPDNARRLQQPRHRPSGTQAAIALSKLARASSKRLSSRRA